MTVKELKAALDNYPDEAKVYVWDYEYSQVWDDEVEIKDVAAWSYTVQGKDGIVRHHCPAGITFR